MQLKITFDLTDDAAGKAARGPRSPTDEHPANRTPYSLLENGRTFPFPQSCMSAALTRRLFFVDYATLQFSFDQSLDQWHHNFAPSYRRDRCARGRRPTLRVCAESDCAA